MTLREKIGLLFILRPEAIGGSMTALTQEGIAFYEKYPAGGFCLFDRNIKGPEQLAAFTQQLHSLGGRFSPILTIDEEGGNVVRIAANRTFDVPRYPAMGNLAAGSDAAQKKAGVFETSRQIGTYLRDYGIDLDFAPVADVNTNPYNPVIGTRAFSSDPKAAAELVAEAVRGFQEAGMGCCLKHWPGHGDTKTDTHKGYASTEKTWEELLACEVLPFEAGIEAGADMVMAAHIAAPAVTGSDEPASLSYTLITEKLRKELGFDGVIVTDSLEMGAVSGSYGPGEAAVLAIQAGADILLMPADYEKAFDAVLAAVEGGEISMERLNESVRRILQMRIGLSSRGFQPGE